MKTITRTVLIADAGMLLTNGTASGKIIYLADGANASEWYEIPEQTEIDSGEGESF